MLVKPENVKQDAKSKCYLCWKEFGTFELEIHFLEVHKESDFKENIRKPYEKCVYCDILILKRSLKTHLEIKHKDAERFTCDICEMFYFKEISLIKHLTTRHQSKDYTCDICSKVSKTRADLINHKEDVHGRSKSLYKCDICEKTCANARSVKTHISYKHQIVLNALLCNICNQSFLNRILLRNHMINVHHSTEKHKCNDCEKTYPSSTKLKEHIKDVHMKRSNSKTCHICSKTLVNRMSLRNHIKHFHVEIQKNLTCRFCSKYFQYPANLSRHIKIKHEEAKSHKCDICGSLSSTIGDLKKHAKQVHLKVGEKSYNCTKCDKSFVSQPTHADSVVVVCRRRSDRRGTLAMRSKLGLLAKRFFSSLKKESEVTLLSLLRSSAAAV